MRREFVLENGKGVVIRCATGVVIDSKTWSETEVTSRQNVGYVTNSGVMVGGGSSVSSKTIEKQELWLKLDDGKEECFRLNNNVLQTRPGHRLSIVLAAISGKEPSALLGIHQFNNDQTIDFTQTNRGEGILLAAGLRNIFLDMLRWAFYCGCVATMIGIPLIPIGAYLVYRGRKKTLKQLSFKLNEIVHVEKKGELLRPLSAA